MNTIVYQGASFVNFMETALPDHSEGEGSWGSSLMLNLLVPRSQCFQRPTVSTFQHPISYSLQGPVLKAGSGLEAGCILWQERHSLGHFLKSTAVTKSEKKKTMWLCSRTPEETLGWMSPRKEDLSITSSKLLPCELLPALLFSGGEGSLPQFSSHPHLSSLLFVTWWLERGLLMTEFLSCLIPQPFSPK